MTTHPWIHRLAPWIAPIFVFLWSTGFIIARYSMPYAEPLTIIFIRFASVVLCMLPVVLIWQAPWPSRSQIMHIAVAGALLQAGYVGGVWAAVKEGMSAGLTALIVGLQPILTAWFVGVNYGFIGRWIGGLGQAVSVWDESFKFDFYCDCFDFNHDGYFVSKKILCAV